MASGIRCHGSVPLLRRLLRTASNASRRSPSTRRYVDRCDQQPDSPSSTRARKWLSTRSFTPSGRAAVPQSVSKTPLTSGFHKDGRGVPPPSIEQVPLSLQFSEGFGRPQAPRGREKGGRRHRSEAPRPINRTAAPVHTLDALHRAAGLLDGLDDSPAMSIEGIRYTLIAPAPIRHRRVTHQSQAGTYATFDPPGGPGLWLPPTDRIAGSA